MNELYVLTVICEEDIYNIVYDKKPSTNQVIDDVFDVHVSEIESLDIDLITNMIAKEVSEVETNSVYIEDLNTKLVFQRINKITDGKKYINVIKYVKDDKTIKEEYRKFINDNFTKLFFTENDEDSLCNFIAYFYDKNNKYEKLYFNCDDYELEQSFLIEAGFKYLGITSAKVYEEDSDTLNEEEILFEYEQKKNK